MYIRWSNGSLRSACATPLTLFVLVALSVCALGGEAPDVAQPDPLQDSPRVLAGHTGAVVSLAFSPDGRLLASASPDRKGRVWDTATGQLVSVLEGHTGGPWGIVFLSESEVAALGKNRVIFWDPETGKRTDTSEIPLVGADNHAFAFDPTGAQFACGGNTYLRLFYRHSAQPRDTFMLARNEVLSLSYSPDGHWLASASRRGLDLLDLRGKRTSFDSVKAAGTKPIMAVVFSADGTRMAAGGEDQRVVVCDVATRQLQQTLTGHQGTVTSVAFFPDGRSLASGSADGTVGLWDAESGKHKRVLQAGRDEVLAVAVSPDGKAVAAGSKDGTIRLWRLE